MPLRLPMRKRGYLSAYCHVIEQAQVLHVIGVSLEKLIGLVDQLQGTKTNGNAKPVKPAEGRHSAPTRIVGNETVAETPPPGSPPPAESRKSAPAADAGRKTKKTKQEPQEAELPLGDL